MLESKKDLSTFLRFCKSLNEYVKKQNTFSLLSLSIKSKKKPSVLTLCYTDVLFHGQCFLWVEMTMEGHKEAFYRGYKGQAETELEE